MHDFPHRLLKGSQWAFAWRSAMPRLLKCVSVLTDSQLTLEAVYSLLGLVSLCHASILDEPPVGAPQGPRRIPWVFWLGAVQQVIPCSRIEQQLHGTVVHGVSPVAALSLPESGLGQQVHMLPLELPKSAGGGAGRAGGCGG